MKAIDIIPAIDLRNVQSKTVLFSGGPGALRASDGALPLTIVGTFGLMEQT